MVYRCQPGEGCRTPEGGQTTDPQAGGEAPVLPARTEAPRVDTGVSQIPTIEGARKGTMLRTSHGFTTGKHVLTVPVGGAVGLLTKKNRQVAGQPLGRTPTAAARTSGGGGTQTSGVTAHRATPTTRHDKPIRFLDNRTPGEDGQRKLEQRVQEAVLIEVDRLRHGTLVDSWVEVTPPAAPVPNCPWVEAPHAWLALAVVRESKMTNLTQSVSNFMGNFRRKLKDMVDDASG